MTTVIQQKINLQYELFSPIFIKSLLNIQPKFQIFIAITSKCFFKTLVLNFRNISFMYAFIKFLCDYYYNQPKSFIKLNKNLKFL